MAEPQFSKLTMRVRFSPHSFTLGAYGGFQASMVFQASGALQALFQLCPYTETENRTRRLYDAFPLRKMQQ